jgi:hypothetical protein
VIVPLPLLCAFILVGSVLVIVCFGLLWLMGVLVWLWLSLCVLAMGWVPLFGCLWHHLIDMVVFSTRHRHGSPSRPSPRSSAASGFSHLLAVLKIGGRFYARERSRAEHFARRVGCSQHEQQAPELPDAVPQPPISRTVGAAVFCPERAPSASGCLSLHRLLHFANGLPTVR